jgi:hypothetical protein
MGLLIKVLLYFCNFIFFAFCFAAHAAEVTFETDVTCKKNNQEAVAVKAGSKIKIDRGENIFAVSPQSVPLLILSPSSDSAKITVTDSNFKSILQQLIQPQIDSEANEIIDSLRRIDALLQKRDYAQAVQIINALKEKYNQLSSVMFMSGTVHYLMNDKTTAIDDLEKGLVIDGHNESAKSLLKKLKGGA